MAIAVSATPSPAVRIFAGVAALYLGVAVYFAGDAALVPWAEGTAIDGLDAERLPLICASMLSMATALALASRIQSVWAILFVLAASFAAQLGWSLWIDAQPFGALGALWETARRLAAAPNPELLFASQSPMAVAIYAMAARTFGADIDVVRGLAAALWTLQTGFVWLIARQIREIKSGALAAAVAVGLTPGAIVYGALPSAEAVFGPLALASIYLILSHRSRGLWLSAALSGLLLALALLTKPSAVAFAAAILAVLVAALLASRRVSTAAYVLGAILAIGLGAAAALGPVISAQSERDASLAAKLTPTLGFELMFGANRASGGVYAVSDLERIGYENASGGAGFAAAERAARALAWDRIAEDPIGFATFAATEKTRRLWSSQEPLLLWTVNAPSRRSAELQRYDVPPRAAAVIDGAHLALLTLAALGAAVLAVRGTVRDPSRWLLILGTFAGLVFIHSLLLAEPRHALAFAPLLGLLGTYALTPQPRAAHAAATDQADRAHSQMVALSPEQRLATVLKQMSKPPRPEDGPADDGPRSSAKGAAGADHASRRGSPSRGGPSATAAPSSANSPPRAPAAGRERRGERDSRDRLVSAPR